MGLLNRLAIGVSLCGLLLTGFSGLAAAKDVALDTDEQKTIYAVGLALAELVDQQLGGFAFDPDEREIVLTGLMDALSKKEPRVDMKEYGPKLQTYARARMEKTRLARMTPEQRKTYEDKKMEAAGKLEKEKTASVGFLDKLAAEKGAVRKPSGLVYRDLVVGKGAQPTASSVVKVHYTGTLRDGTVFDSSVERGKPVEFPLNRVIPCWTEALQLMKVGGKATIGCPSEIAYGDGGASKIPGGAALSFEVELLDIVK